MSKCEDLGICQIERATEIVGNGLTKQCAAVSLTIIIILFRGRDGGEGGGERERERESRFYGTHIHPDHQDRKKKDETHTTHKRSKNHFVQLQHWIAIDKYAANKLCRVATILKHLFQRVHTYAF